MSGKSKRMTDDQFEKLVAKRAGASAEIDNECRRIRGKEDEHLFEVKNLAAVKNAWLKWMDHFKPCLKCAATLLYCPEWHRLQDVAMKATEVLRYTNPRPYHD